MKYKHTVGDKTAYIDVTETEKNPILIPLSADKYIQDQNCEHFKLRSILIQKLEIASKFLPQGHQFKIFETYRSLKKQKAFWDEEISKTKKLHPDWSEEQINAKANEGIANPYQIGSGHQTGAALDLTICKNGKELDMGTSYLDTSNPKTPTFSNGLTTQQTQNRALLFFFPSFISP